LQLLPLLWLLPLRLQLPRAVWLDLWWQRLLPTAPGRRGRVRIHGEVLLLAQVAVYKTGGDHRVLLQLPVQPYRLVCPRMLQQ